MPCGNKAGGSLSLCSSGKLLASCSTDGSVALLDASSLAASGSARGSASLHATSSGGATAVAFDASGRHFASAGPDGSLIIHTAPGAGHLATCTPVEALPAALGAAASNMDAADSSDEPTVVQLLDQQRCAGRAAATEEQRQQVSASSPQSLAWNTHLLGARAACFWWAACHHPVHLGMGVQALPLLPHFHCCCCRSRPSCPRCGLHSRN